ncbi:hypothetical protein N7G274_010593 [Stereocaulon virgatum]|uniref:Uncharacterized protein n=1 Tax=Stereocaulon virgatum TaxID=373712 RepID=A0ABR3ZTX3_9LECA
MATLLKTSTTRAERTARRNCGNIDEKVLWEEMEAAIENSVYLTREEHYNPMTPAQIDALTADLIGAIQRAIDTSTHFSRPSNFNRPGFTEDCKEAKGPGGTPEAYTDNRLARNHKTAVLRKARRR